jgi:CheY-like chemotaxis protein
MPLKCPKCSAPLAVTPDELGVITCASCGARFRSPAPVKFTVQGGSVPPGPLGPRTDPPAKAPDPPGSRTEPPTRFSEPAARDSGLPPLSDVDAVLARIDSPPSPDSTIRPVMLGKIAIPRPSTTPVPPSAPATLEAVLAEVRAVRQTQEQILELLRGRRPARNEDAQLELSLLRPALAVRGSVLLIDDDPRARGEAAQALQSIAAVRTEADGSGALASIAMDKPDVIVLEPNLAGATPGAEVLDVIRSTVEWAGIPVVLYARQPAGAAVRPGSGDAVAKGPGSAQALASRVGALLQKP